MQNFVTEVRTLPRAHFAEVDGSSYSHLPETLKKALARSDIQVDSTWTVPSSPFDLMIFGRMPDEQAVLKIDAICKSLGYEARTHLVWPTDLTRKAAQEAVKILDAAGVPAEAVGR